ncbi:hypothetical protein JCM10213_007807 [Rhodosporidiobolus nylandii]
MSLQHLLGESTAPLRQPAAYNPTRRVTPAASVLVPISRTELAQCQTSVNPLRTRPPVVGGGAPAAPAPGPGIAGLPAKPQGPLPPPDREFTPGVGGSGRKRPNRDDDAPREAYQGVQKRPRESYAGDVRTVADHYNARPNTDRVSRNDSPIIGLKNFNNWIKSVLIAKHGRRENDRDKPRIRVLDLGCGKGGDLQKWSRAGTEEYVGIDIAMVSVEQARDRYEDMHRNRRPPFPASFFALDCFASSIEEVLEPTYFDPKPFDVVSMQFCMHYALESEEKARQMLSNVSRFLRPGGIFLGTIPDATNLFQHLDTAAEANPDDPAAALEFGNSIYRVKFDARESESVYGHRYTFFLQDAVEEVPEYVVYWDNFVALAAEYGLSCVYSEAFQNIFIDEQDDPQFKQLLLRMKVMDEEGNAEMDEDQLDAAMLYMGFAFVKEG